MPVTRSSVAAAVKRAGWRPAAALAGAAAVALTGAVVPAAAAPGQSAGHAAPPALAPPGLFTWGDEWEGALGNGIFGWSFGGKDAQQVDTPAPVALPAGVTQLVASETNGFALLSNGKVAVWGANDYGQLGDGSGDWLARPFVLPGPTGITQVAAHGFHVLAVDSSGAVWAWGDNNDGEAGDGTAGGDVPFPQRVPGLSGVVQVARWLRLRHGHRLARAADPQRDRLLAVRRRAGPGGGRLRARPGGDRRRPHLPVPWRGHDADPGRGNARPSGHGRQRDNRQGRRQVPRLAARPEAGSCWRVRRGGCRDPGSPAGPGLLRRQPG